MSLVTAASSMTVGLFLWYNLWQLAVYRAVVGLGAAGLELLILVIINDQVDLYSLPLWRTIVTVVSTLAGFLGPSAGAAITDRAGFRLSNDKRVAPTGESMDHIGAGILLLAVATPLLALDLGGQVLPWSHPVMILLCILSPALVILFFHSQSRRRGQTLLKYGLGQYVQARSMTSTSTSTFSDWALSCVFLGIPLGSFFSGIIIRRYCALKLLLRVVAVLNLLAYLCFAAGWIHPENPAFAPVLLLVGLNVGVLDSCWLVSIFSQASPEDQPTLYAFFDLGRANTGNFGIAMALASTNAMIRSNLQSKLINYPDKEEIIRKSLEGFSAISQFPPAVQRIVLDAFISSSEKAFGT
ncbi:MFS general substrate transporter [Xylariaceae sp. AK1471]|nr:MFS general substrate transporter [Xylariaceae sp. AK1471]